MNKGKSDICNVAKAADVFCKRWTVCVLYALGEGATRFTELQQSLQLMSRSLLSQRLKELDKEGVIERRPNPSGRGWTYHLTPAGLEFLPLVKGLSDWGKRWSRRELAEGQVDFTLLLWDMERSVRADAFGGARIVVQLEFTDQPPNRRYWWFVNEGGRAALCLKDPGFGVDLHISATLPDMTRIWRGELPLEHALESGRFEAHGPAGLRRSLREWLPIGNSARTRAPSIGTRHGSRRAPGVASARAQRTIERRVVQR